MKNYYELLGIANSATIDQINSAYTKHITHYNRLTQINNNDVMQIKELKKALYILTNDNLKTLYDKKLFTKEFNYEPEIQCANTFTITDDNLDVQFTNIMNEENADSNETKKNKLDSCVLGNRVFSLSHLNKTPSLNEFNLKLRKPENGRIEKNN